MIIFADDVDGYVDVYVYVYAYAYAYTNHQCMVN